MIIGLCGTQGSGKSTVSKILNNMGFTIFIFSDIFKEECIKRNLEPNRDNLFIVSKELTSRYGKDYAAKRILEKLKASKDYCIDGFRRVEEVKAFKDLILIAIDAPIELRYRRIRERKSQKDNISFEHFKEQDEKELLNVENNINIKAVMEMAKYKIMNDKCIDDLKKEITNIISENTN